MSILKKFGSKTKVADPNKPLSNTKNWYADRYQTILVQRNILAAITFVALLATLISSYSVAQLTPLKSVQPFVIQVDEKSGATLVVDPMKDKEIQSNDSLKQFFLVRYIQAREGYNDVNYKDNYNIVRLMTDPAIFKAYQDFISPDNPASPAVVYARHSRRQVDFVSMTFVNENSAQIRVAIKSEGQVAERLPPQNMVIWVSFEFIKMELNQKDRYINPLGFRVTSYMIDEELVAK